MNITIASIVVIALLALLAAHFLPILARRLQAPIFKPARYPSILRNWRKFHLAPRGLSRYLAWIPGQRIRWTEAFCRKRSFTLPVQFANEGTTSTMVLVEIANDLKLDEQGLIHIAPLGDHPGMALVDDGKGGLKKVKAIQRIDAEACASMANEFAESSKGLKRFLAGRPIYVGHPDVPGYEGRYPDKTIKGQFTELVNNKEIGLCGKPVFTNEGSQLVQGDNPKFKAVSGRWNADPAGNMPDGTPIFRPTVFLSAGLTNQPNLPVQLLNEAEPAAESPADRASKFGLAAYDASGAAHKSSYSARVANTPESNIDAFHSHAAASFAHCQAANCQKAEMKNEDLAAEHAELAEEHRKAAIAHFRSAKKLGKAPEPVDADAAATVDKEQATAQAANEKEIITQAQDDKVVVLPLKAQLTTLANDKATLETEKATLASEKATLTTAQTTLANERDQARANETIAKGKETEAVSRVTALSTERDTLTQERDTARQQFANERTAHIKTALDNGIVRGKISQAERVTWENRLKVAGQFANEMQALNNQIGSKVQRVKVESVTLKRENRTLTIANESDRKAAIEQIYASIANEKGWDRVKQQDQIFAAACQAFPDLMGTANQPTIRR